MAIQSAWVNVPEVVTEEYITAAKNRDQMETLQSRDLFLLDKFDNYDTIVSVDNKIAGVIQNIDWKESVDSFADIQIIYPTPDDGWTVNVKDTNYTYRYDSETQSWIVISANAIPNASNTVNGLLVSADYTALHQLVEETVPLIYLRMSQIEQKMFPLGTIVPYSIDENTPPTGFLFAEGQLVNRSDYPDLWNKLYFDDPDSGYDLTVSEADKDLYPGSFTDGDGTTTFRLPDLRGLFIRAWDAGKGYDNGREILSYQDDNIKEHSHTIETSAIGSFDQTDTTRAITFSNVNSTLSNISTNASGSGVEDRPKNVSMRYIIKVIPSEKIETDGTTTIPSIGTNVNATTLNSFGTSYTSSPNTIPVGNATTGKLDTSWIDLGSLEGAYVLTSSTSSIPANSKIPIASNNGTLDAWVTAATNTQIDTLFNSIFV